MTTFSSGQKRQSEDVDEPGMGSPKRIRQLSMMPDGDETAEDFQVLSELEAMMDSDDKVEHKKPS